MSGKRKDHKGHLLRTGESQRKDLTYQFRYTDVTGKRRTFCTNMANAGMDLKSLQYLMGHSDAGATMNVYTHTSYAQAEKSMQKILKFEPPKEVKTG